MAVFLPQTEVNLMTPLEESCNSHHTDLLQSCNTLCHKKNIITFTVHSFPASQSRLTPVASEIAIKLSSPGLPSPFNHFRITLESTDVISEN